MIGTRWTPPGDGWWTVPMQPAGTYWLDTVGAKRQWYAVTPNGALCGLANHAITEHEDGTITVSPSIRVSRGSEELWHGWLERGVWRSC